MSGEISLDEAERLLKIMTVEEIGTLAKIDVGREMRKGIPEIILAEGKRAEDVAQIAQGMLDERGMAMISRAKIEQIEAVRRNVQGDVLFNADEKVGTVVIRKKDFVIRPTGGKVGILTAGTSDIPIAEEARMVAEGMGCDVIIAVAGREGALPSVVAGLVDIPVIGVPTSIGYGLGEKGIGALTAMLQTCSLGLAVVNIDGGIPAGAITALIANRMAKIRGHG